MIRSRRLWAVVLSVFLLGMLAARFTRLRNDITDFIPRSIGSERLQLAAALPRGPGARVMVFTVSGTSAEARVAATDALAEHLRTHAAFEWVQSGLTDTQQKAFFEQMFPARLGLAGPWLSEGRLSDETLASRVTDLKRALGGPASALVRPLAPKDPLQLFTATLDRLAGVNRAVRNEGAQLVTRDGRWSVLMAATQEVPFNGPAQRRVMGVVESGKAELERLWPGTVVEVSGINRFAQAAETAIRADVQRITGLSLLGILLLYLVVFRSVSKPLLATVPIAAGVVTATLACQLAFGSIHGLTLAFGAALIGVAIDYATHFFVHRDRTQERSEAQVMSDVWPALWLGALTTCIGVLALGVLPFSGFRQIALFSVVGVGVALFVTRWLLAGVATASRGGTRAMAARLEALLGWLRGQRVAALLVVAAGGALVLGGFPQLRWVDDVQALTTPTPQVKAESDRVQARLGRRGAGQLVVSVGRDDEQALERAGSAALRLEELSASGSLAGFRGVGSWLPSVAAQQASHAALSQDASLWPRLRGALERGQFVAEAFAPFRELLKKPLTAVEPRHLLESELAPLLAPMRVSHAGQILWLTSLDGVRDPEQIERALADLDGVYYVDQPRLLEGAYSKFRLSALKMIGAGLVLVLLCLAWRYRDGRMALAALAPAMLSCGVALALQALLGRTGNLMHLVGILLVLSMGVDYGIYLLEARRSSAGAADAMVSVVLAAITTCLSFGLLAASDNPALAAIGWTASLGVMSAALVTPCCWALWAGPEEKS